ncbi:MAG: hypothetical protein NWF01_00170, partial [Candidatus Bathyarchaeota archaeon]|nr:hypothetical protein [Candidatus Bathyarchaeota archaeon]
VSKLSLSKANRQWGKIPKAEKGKDTYEIDLIGNSKKATYVFEIKWQELKYSDSLRCLEHLVSKAKFVEKLPQDVLFGIVAKRIDNKEKIRAAKYLAYDLDDFDY